MTGAKSRSSVPAQIRIRPCRSYGCSRSLGTENDNSGTGAFRQLTWSEVSGGSLPFFDVWRLPCWSILDVRRATPHHASRRLSPRIVPLRTEIGIRFDRVYGPAKERCGRPVKVPLPERMAQSVFPEFPGPDARNESSDQSIRAVRPSTRSGLDLKPARIPSQPLR